MQRGLLADNIRLEGRSNSRTGLLLGSTIGSLALRWNAGARAMLGAANQE